MKEVKSRPYALVVLPGYTPVGVSLVRLRDGTRAFGFLLYERCVPSMAPDVKPSFEVFCLAKTPEGEVVPEGDISLLLAF